MFGPRIAYVCAALTATVLLAGCSEKKSTPEGEATPLPAQSEVTSGSQPASQVRSLDDTPLRAKVAEAPVEVMQIPGKVFLATPTQLVVHVPPSGGHEHPASQMGGNFEIEQVTSQPLPLVVSSNPDYLVGTLPAAVNPPVRVSVELFFQNSTVQKYSFILDSIVGQKAGELTATQASAPELTTAALGMVVEGDQTVIGVLGKNLQDAHLFLRSGTSEISIPVDSATSSSLAVLEPSMQSLLKPGTWDVVARTPYGEAQLPAAVVIPADK